MKKKLFIVLLIGVIMGIFVVNNVCNNSYSSKSIIENSTTSNAISTVSTLSMMLETRAASGVYEVSSDTSWPTSGYVFNEELSYCKNGSTFTYNTDTKSITFNVSVSDLCYVFFDVISNIGDVCDTGDILAECIQELYNVTGEGLTNIYYHDGEGDYGSLEVGDYSYRYSGASDEVLNYVCFGSDYCSDSDNLYRVIGIFENENDNYEVKLIKATSCTNEICGKDGEYAGTGDYYYWGSDDGGNLVYNVWSYSQLNITNLNKDYYENFNENWQSIITTHSWIVGGARTSIVLSKNSNNIYAYEITNPNSDFETTYAAKIGLFYVTDYGYATIPTYWSTNVYNYSNEAYLYDWMYNGLSEWSITRLSDSYEDAAYLDYRGFIYIGIAYQNYYFIRPTFYLNSSVQYSSGSGTFNDPIILVTE